MTSRKTRDDVLPQGVHTIVGCWTTKALRIDGDAITPEMVRERVDRAGLSSGFAPVDAFAWGPDAPLPAVRLLAYGCCACTVPASWIRHRAAHMALEALFLHRLYRLRPADFTLHYRERALQNAMRRIQRRWVQQLRQQQHTLRL
jgi:hypothetical protein